jgi:glycosyltransferase involved in cell wall biosynthesis
LLGYSLPQHSLPRGFVELPKEKFIMLDLRKAEPLQLEILFVSTMAGDPWGGSEELWSQAALRLSSQGVPVAASVHGWPNLDSRVMNLSKSGILVRPRPLNHSLITLARRYISGKSKIVFDIEEPFGNSSPHLVVMSDGGPIPPIELVELCVKKRWPFVTLGHANFDGAWWFPDDLAARYRQMLPFARRCFFVSEANRALTEMQLGYAFDNAEVIQNPLTLDLKSPIPWPASTFDKELRLACVGRLYPAAKGQDILLQALAKPRWANRNWRLNLYGEGPNRDILERLIRRLNLTDRVALAGHVPAIQIWRENHVLVLPSRYEGLPLTIVEAMACGRPVVATNVAGHSEVITDGVTGFLAEAATVQSVDKALECMWEQRNCLQSIGSTAEVSIRKYLQKDPVGVFVDKIRNLAGLRSNP